MTTKTFTDYDGDSLRVSNYGSHSAGDLTVTQGQVRPSTFSLDKDNRLDIAAEILSPLKAVVIEGPLPEAKLEQTWNGVDRIMCDGMTGEISQAEVDYFLKTGKQRLAIANAITKALADKEAKAEEARQARLAEVEKLKARRDKLAQEFTSLPWINYGGVNVSTRTAIDRVIELEDAAK